MPEPAEPSDAPRVLIVDDASLVRLFYRQTLESAGYVVDEAINGIEALEKVLGGTYDVLLVDINMPKMDGLAFLRALRRRDLPVASTPALVTSSEADSRDFAVARRAGANFYLVKPVAPDELLRHAAALTGRCA